jgi:hypothetical protein
MECLDISKTIQTTIAISLIVSGNLLMLEGSTVSRNYGSYCFALGFLLLGLEASGHSVESSFSSSRRLMLGLGSAAAVVAGTFLTYYHIQDVLDKYLAGKFKDYDKFKEDVAKSITLLDYVLMYGGYLGLVAAISMKEDGGFHLTKLGLSLGSVAVMCYTNKQMIDAFVSGENVYRNQLLHVLSWGLLVVAIAYKC